MEIVARSVKNETLGVFVSKSDARYYSMMNHIKSLSDPLISNIDLNLAGIAQYGLIPPSITSNRHQMEVILDY